ncbi:MAG: hypothetical protein EB101_07965 [Chitinophagia bacterium]|nr:hypothetical protein [Chitinophagia bacterium]
MTPATLPPSSPTWVTIPSKAYSLEYLIPKSQPPSVAFNIPILITVKQYPFPALHYSLAGINAARFTTLAYRLDYIVADIKKPRPVFELK